MKRKMGVMIPAALVAFTLAFSSISSAHAEANFQPIVYHNLAAGAAFSTANPAFIGDIFRAVGNVVANVAHGVVNVVQGVGQAFAAAQQAVAFVQRIFGIFGSGNASLGHMDQVQMAQLAHAEFD